jgi:hypothetical protein
MEAKPVAGGIRYFWNAPTWARKHDRPCPIKSEALGADYAAAKARCDDYLNPLFKSWLTGGVSDAKRRFTAGTFDWLIVDYKSSKKYTKRPARTRSSYDRALEDVAGYILKDGRRFGELHVNSIKAATIDKLYKKLKVSDDGKQRHRSALLAMTVCTLAWKVAQRNHPTIIPAANPFKGIDVEYEPKQNRAAKLAQLMQFVRAADEDGTPSLGTAAMIAFYWLVREEDIFGRMARLSPRRRSERSAGLAPQEPQKREDRRFDGTELWPEMVARIEGLKRNGTLIVMRDRPDPRKKIHMPWTTGGRNPMRWVQAEVRRICRAAGLPDEITFTSFRHGGHTDGADSGLTDAQMRALGAHKTTAALLRYSKETEQQRRDGARKRLNKRTERGNLSE